jgi:hypothetical protein
MARATTPSAVSAEALLHGTKFGMFDTPNCMITGASHIGRRSRELRHSSWFIAIPLRWLSRPISISRTSTSVVRVLWAMKCCGWAPPSWRVLLATLDQHGADRWPSDANIPRW